MDTREPRIVNAVVVSGGVEHRALNDGPGKTHMMTLCGRCWIVADYRSDGRAVCKVCIRIESEARADGHR